MGELVSQNYLYLNVSKGFLVNTKKGKQMRGYAGYLIGIREVVDKFEGNDVKKIELKVRDNESEEVALIKFSMESWYSLGFFARIQKIDISKPFTLGALPSEQNEKMSFCYLKQEGKDKIEADKEFPRYGVVTVSDKKVQDWSKPFEKMRAIIVELNASIAKNAPPAAATNPAVAAAESDEAPETIIATGSNASDDLPF